MITKAAMEGRNRRSKKRDGGKARLGERTYMYACSTHKDLCTGKFNSKVNSQAHGSPEDAMRCMRRAARVTQETNA